MGIYQNNLVAENRMANKNPIGLGLPSESVKSLGELYLSLGSSKNSFNQKSQNKITFARNRWYNIPYNENGRKAPRTIHQFPIGRGGFKEKALFTNNISSAPTVMITPVNTVGDNLWVFPSLITTTTSSFTVAFANQNVASRADMEFNFMVIGTN